MMLHIGAQCGSMIERRAVCNIKHENRLISTGVVVLHDTEKNRRKELKTFNMERFFQKFKLQTATQVPLLFLERILFCQR
jgi:hypothetical protein